MRLRMPYPENVGLRIEGDAATAEFSLAESYPYFEGHFPGNPIVPAVTQIAWALVAIEAWRKAPLAAYRLSRFKFVLPLKPGMAVKVSLVKAENRYAYRLLADGALCSSGSVNLAE